MRMPRRTDRFWVVSAVAAGCVFAAAPSQARDANELLMKAVGTTENVSPVIVEAIQHALTYPTVKKIIYTSAGGDAAKAVSDMRAYIAQKADIIVIFADAGP